MTPIRCYICNYNQEQEPGFTNKVFVDKETGLEVCQECHDIGVQALAEFEDDDAEPSN